MSASREYNTQWARANREKKKAAKNASALRCQTMLARRRPCRTALQNRFVNGETIPWCPTCDRKERGVCITCGTERVAGQARKALYCVGCKRLADQAAYAKYQKANAAKLRKKEKLRMADPVRRADRLQYKRLWRQSMPKKVANYKREDVRRNAEKQREYHAAYRARHAEARRERERLRNAGLLPPRACLTCPTIITGRAKRCDGCKRNDQLAARALIGQRLERVA